MKTTIVHLILGPKKSQRHLTPELHAKLDGFLSNGLPKPGPVIEAEKKLKGEDLEKIREALRKQGMKIITRDKKADIDEELRKAIWEFQDRHVDLQPTGLITDAVQSILLRNS